MPIYTFFTHPIILEQNAAELRGIYPKRLKTDIKSLEIKILTLYGAGFLILLGVLAKGFHWF
jgi:hypothetical protein